MKTVRLKWAGLLGSCAVAVVLGFAYMPDRHGAPPLDQQASSSSGNPEKAGQPATLTGCGVPVRIEVVWSQYAWAGVWVEIIWVPDPKSPDPHYERIAEKVLVLSWDGHNTRDGEPSDFITVDAAADQAERLKEAQNRGWLRALPCPLGDRASIRLKTGKN